MILSLDGFIWFVKFYRRALVERPCHTSTMQIATERILPEAMHEATRISQGVLRMWKDTYQSPKSESPTYSQRSDHRVDDGQTDSTHAASY